MSTRLALCNAVLPGPRPVDLSTGFSILPGRPEAIAKSIGSAAFLSACEGHNTRSQAVGSGPFINRYSVEFDGTTGYMKASGTELDLKSNFSTSGWYTAPDPSSANGFLWFWGQNTGGKRRSLMLVNGKFYINFHNPLESGPSSTSTLSANTWYHVVTTFNADYTEAKIYVNGTLEDTQDFSSIALDYTYSETYLSVVPAVGQGVPNMLIDEFSIFNSVLSASDVTSIYNEGAPNDISSLEPVGWWRMGDSNSGVGTTVTDVGSGGNDGTLVNGAEFIDKTVLRKPEDATVVYNYPETSDIPSKPVDLSVSLSSESSLIDPTDLQVLLYPPNLRISIQDTEANILARTGDAAGTMAFGTDTNNLYIANTEGFDSWSSIEDN